MVQNAGGCFCSVFCYLFGNILSVKHSFRLNACPKNLATKMRPKLELEPGTCPLIVSFSGNEPDLGIRARYGQSSYEFVIYLLLPWFTEKDHLVTTWSWQTVDAVVGFVHRCRWIHQLISPHIISQLLPNANSEEAIKRKTWRILVAILEPSAVNKSGPRKGAWDWKEKRRRRCKTY